MNFKLTYATMFNPPADMHAQFDAALVELNASLGGTHTLYIDGKDRDSAMNDARRSPIDQRCILGHFSLATVDDVDHAMAAAQAAFQSWRATPMAERVGLLKRVATLIEERVYHIAAAVALEYEQDVRTTLPTKTGEVSRFDLILLGADFVAILFAFESNRRGAAGVCSHCPTELLLNEVI